MHSQAVWAYIHHFSQHLASKPPSRLFYYAASSKALQIFRSEELRTESLSFASKNSEANKALRFSLKLVDKLLEKTNMPHDLNKALQLSYSIHPKKRYGLYQFLLLKQLREKLEFHLKGTHHILYLSLSTCEDSLEYWASVAAEGGYALGFSSDTLSNQASEQHFSLLPCYYSTEVEQKSVLQGALLGSLQAWLSKIQALYEKELDVKKAFTQGLEIIANEAERVHNIVLQVISLIKDDHFKHEEEWRLLSQAVPAAFLHYDEEGSMFVPYAPFDYADSLRLVTIHQHEAAKAALGLRGFLSTKRSPQELSIALSKHTLSQSNEKVIRLKNQAPSSRFHSGSENLEYKPDVS